MLFLHVLDGGKLVVAHAGMKQEMQGRGSGAVRDFALYGETTGETDALVVMGGMVSSTLLTLFVVPAVYSLVEGGIERLHAPRRAGEEQDRHQSHGDDRERRQRGHRLDLAVGGDARFLLVSFDTDWRFPTDQSRVIADRLLASKTHLPHFYLTIDCDVDALLSAQIAHLHLDEEKDARYFEGCLPIEVLAARDPMALAFGLHRPGRWWPALAAAALAPCADERRQARLALSRLQARAGVSAPGAAWDVLGMLDEMRLVKDAGELADLMDKAAYDKLVG